MKKVPAILVIIVALALAATAWAAQSPQVPLAGAAIPQFVDPLPTLSAAGGTMSTVFADTGAPLTLRMCEFDANVLPTGTFVAGQKPLTRVWGYLVDPTGTSTCAQLIDQNKNVATGAIDTYIGPVVLAKRGTPSPITFVNDLGSAATTGVLAYKYSTDQTLHWADPLKLDCMMTLMGAAPAFGSDCAQNYQGAVPAVPHLHGGEVPAELDGGPDSWFTSDGLHKGAKFYSAAGAPANAATLTYPNVQEAAPIWFHDHTLGATRLNVYAGLAGAYLIRDDSLTLPAGLGPYGLARTTGGPDDLTVPLVIQDRMFDTNGQLFFPSDSAGGVLSALNPEHPYWVPELVGDTIVVNGKAWPFLNVKPQRYRFLLLNGSNARTYEMSLQSAGGATPPIWVIATDGGYLDVPVSVKQLVMQPGERYEVIIDFAGLAGSNVILKNAGRTPYPNGAPPQGATLGRMMQFRVGTCASVCPADTSYDPALAAPIRGGTQLIQRLVNPATGALATGVTASKTRQLTLNEIMGMPITAVDPVTGLTTKYPGGPLEILVNNTKFSGVKTGQAPRTDFTPISAGGETLYFSEMPKEGDTEVWEIVNTTADAHPIHLHLVQFQVMSRQNYNASKYTKAYAAAFPGIPGDPVCTVGVFCPGYGPPKAYDFYAQPANIPVGGRAVYGGNPDITPYLQGKPLPALPEEQGWKDTVITYPGQVTRIAVRWAPTSLPTTATADQLHFPFDPSAYDPASGTSYNYNYVWHCHIVDHEDNEMMRPDVVQLNPAAPLPAARPLRKGFEY